MANYRVPEFTAEQRTDIALRMLLPFPDRPWGLGTELARLYGVSRTLVYQIRDRARNALVEALLPRDAGRPVQATTLTVDQSLVDRAIVTLPLLKGSRRDIRLGLPLLLGTTRSVGYISQTLTAAGAQAEASNLSLRLPLPMLKEPGHRDIITFAEDLWEKLPQLLVPLEWLERHLRPVLQDWQAETQAFLLWAWQHCLAVNLNIATDLPEALHAVVNAAWDILSLFHRSSSLAEALPSQPNFSRCKKCPPISLGN